MIEPEKIHAGSAGARLRILHVIDSLTYGGAERLLLNTCKVLHPRHEIHVAYLKLEPLLKGDFPPDVTIHSVPLGPSCTAALRRLVKRLKPHIVHTHLGHSDLLGMWACRGLPVRRFCTMHNIWFKWSWKDRLIFAAYRFLFATIARDCRVVCISRCVQEHVRSRLGVPASRTRIIYNAIPDLSVTVSKEEARAGLGIDPRIFCFLMVGRLHLQKSIDTLIRAVAELKTRIGPFTVQIVGTGPERERLEALAVQLGVADCVSFRGTTHHPELYFAAADVFVLPSIFEGLGIVLLEAFRAGLPAIASDVEGPKELIRQGENGLLFPPRASGKLAESMVLLYRDGNLRRRLAERGREDYKTRHRIETYALDLEEFYRSRS